MPNLFSWRTQFSPWSPKPHEGPPPVWLALLEGRAVLEACSIPVALPWLLSRLPKGDGHPVMVLPGLMASDLSTRPLRQFLKSLGYRARGWGQGRNLGPREGVQDGLRERLQQMHSEAGTPVSLIGWSLGGLFARELARQRPDLTRQVISLGSPLYGTPGDDSNPLVWQIYKHFNETHPERIKAFRGDCAPPVPTTSVYTRGDSVVAWAASVEQTSGVTDNIEINSASHLGLGFHPMVWYAIGDRLAQPQDNWKKFNPPPPERWLFPASSTASAAPGSPPGPSTP